MTRTRGDRKRERPSDRQRVTKATDGAMGLESEFSVLLDGQLVKPEDVFASPTNIVSFNPGTRRSASHTVGKLALLLTYIRPIPVMMFAANRKSTGIGVRPRGRRVEVTADFTPDPPLMIATATLCVGIIEAVMRWPTFELSALDRFEKELPVIEAVHPVPHSSRKGWSMK